MDDNHKISTNSARATAKEGETLAKRLKAGDILCLYGQLGSGKTTFVQGLARGLGITTRLLSPTFIIVRRYDIPSSEKILYHVDLYRLQNRDEMDELGLDEIISDPNAYVVIEWAEKLGELLPNYRLDIHLRVLEDGRHEIKVKKY